MKRHSEELLIALRAGRLVARHYPRRSRCRSTRLRRALAKACFYGNPTLSTWFTSEYKKSGKKLDMGKGCVRFKSLENLALGVRFAGRELYGGRPRAVVSWSREAGAAVLVETGRPHRCARVRGGAHGQLPGGEGAHE